MPQRTLTISLALVSVIGLTAAPAGAAVAALSQASGPSPFAPNCHGAPQNGTLFVGSEVEPWIDLNPTNPANLIGVYQQDRFSSGGASGLGTSVSTNGGGSWTQVAGPTFSRCSGAAAGSVGDYERATDPWVTFGPDGHAYQMSLSFNDTRDLANAMLVSESLDGGMTWGTPIELIRDTNPHVFNDKNSMTADQTSANHVYGIWDRLVFPNERAGGKSFLTAAAFRGPTYFTRTTNGGASWEPARNIFDPGQNDQTIGNQISVTGEGDLVNIMTVFRNDNGEGRKGGTISVLRSEDKGAAWSGEIVVDRLGTVGVRDPRDGAPVRTGDIIPSIATDERVGHDEVYAVWQDARWTGFQNDGIAFSKSTDGGLTWTPAVRINAVASTQAFTPAIEVDDQGNIAVLHYDFRNDTVSGTPLLTDAWILRSSNGGATWSEERVTPTSFDMRQAPFARGFFVGDYIGLGATGATFKPFFTQSNPATDTFSTTVSAPFPPATIVPEPSPAGLNASAFASLHRGRPAPA
ncbi:Neuraminidase (sialidase) [Alloactinosynnema sp. L-07]|uniref:sialidase family protein n=1 Tax=Alloactinosynnema sp. L-07 TaxID=1653480 RepID=UPI00065EF78D|nr:sialidase family protein [Alloactinosynnema sp. L-07]CRK56754.1 Neuraminidase (sialidase) [Alloactinosynnema sp. L-07]